MSAETSVLLVQRLRRQVIVCRVRDAGAVPGSHEVGAGADAAAELDIGSVVTDHEGPARVDPKLPRCTVDHAGPRFAATTIVIGRVRTYVDAAKLDAGAPDATTLCAMAKRFATDAGFMVCNEALQLHGGYGYLRDFPVERHLRDLRVHQILEGTNEIMRVIIARRLLCGNAPL